MNDWNIGGVVLPGDLEWIDEFTPARKQADSMSLAGTSIVQRSTQVNGLRIWWRYAMTRQPTCSTSNTRMAGYSSADSGTATACRWIGRTRCSGRRRDRPITGTH